MHVSAINDDFTILAILDNNQYYFMFDNGDKEKTTKDAIISAMSKGVFFPVFEGNEILFGEENYIFSNQGYNQKEPNNVS